jgi:hypothetical protein
LTSVLEVTLLDGNRPGRELLDLLVPGFPRQDVDDLPVADLTRLGHRQKLEAVERVGVIAEIRPRHLLGLTLRLTRLLEQRCLLALDGRREPCTALLGLGRLSRHAVERPHEIASVLLLRELLHLQA